MAELELNSVQLERNDAIFNAVHDMCKVLTNDDMLDWDMYFIGDIADYAATRLTNYGKSVYFPSVITEENGTQHIEDIFHTT